MMLHSFNLSLLLVLLTISVVAAYKELSDNSLKAIPSAGDDFDIKKGAILAPLLKVRVAGTPGNIEVRHHLVDYFKKTLPNWELIWENSTQPTILNKDVQFANIIFRRDPPWAKKGDVGRLVLAAHYDSKLEPEGFIGAVDSAAPCAMMIHAARSIDAALTRKWDAMQKAGQKPSSGEKGIELYFLDGEEAFSMWTDTDSIYGARSLAATLERTVNPAMSTYRTHLNQISLFLLLDLLGSAGPMIPSYFPTTHWSYKNMANVEKRLRALQLMESSPNSKKNRAKGARKSREPMFLNEGGKNVDSSTYWMGGQIEDDHIPFLQRGVPCLHIIPSPFPDVWHTIEDDGAHLHIPTVQDWAKIVTGFAAEWMELEGYMGTANKARSIPSLDEMSLEDDTWAANDEQIRVHNEL